MAKIRVGINGFGRIGRNFFRAQLERGGDFEIVAVNDLGDAKTMAHLLKYDSVLGRSTATVEARRRLDPSPAARRSRCLAERDPAQLPWGDLGVDVAIESTGFFTKREGAQKHLDAGAKKVVISAPATDPDVTIVLGVNDGEYDPEQHNIISNASCTTNCVAPMAKVLHEAYTIERGFMTTIHAYTNDQHILDLPHKDLRRARAAAINLIPTSTGAARAIGARAARAEGQDRRHVDARARCRPARSSTSSCRSRARRARDEVNELFRSKADTGDLEGILQYTDEPLVSTDIVHSPYSSIFDSELTMVNGQPREGLRLVRQRVGLQLPARRPRREDRADDAGRRRGLMRLPRSVRDADVARQDRARPLRPERAARGRRGRRRHAHPRLAADARAAARAAARPRCASARTSAGRRRRRTARSTRWRPSSSGCASCCPTSGSACSRTRASTRARRRTTRRSRASSPTAATSTSTTRSAPRTARTPRPRASRTCCPRTPGCCCSRSSSISASCSATSSGRSSSSPAARRSTTSSACCRTSAAARTRC